MVTLESKWSPKARFFRGQIFSGKKGFAGVSESLQEPPRATRAGGGGVPIRILRSSRLRGLEAAGWELRGGGEAWQVGS